MSYMMCLIIASSGRVVWVLIDDLRNVPHGGSGVGVGGDTDGLILV